jgi:hypothetical protein
MESTAIAATAAAFGSLLGATASIATTWITQRTQLIRADKEWKSRERESLYKEFITEASRVAIDAVTHSLEKPDQLMGLYGILGRIRLMSGDEVVRQGEACCYRIIGLYGRPNLTTEQIHAAIEAHDLEDVDPLREFSIACRNELLAGRP